MEQEIKEGDLFLVAIKDGEFQGEYLCEVRVEYRAFIKEGPHKGEEMLCFDPIGEGVQKVNRVIGWCGALNILPNTRKVNPIDNSY